MRKLIAGAIVVIGLSAACGGTGGTQTASLVDQFAECLSDPANALHVAAGSPTFEVARENIRADLNSGENSLADIEAALALYCND